MNIKKLSTLLFLIYVLSAVSRAELPSNYNSLSKEEKIDWLIENMSLEEKVIHINTSPKGKASYRQNYDAKYKLPGFVSCDGPRGVKVRGVGIVNFPSSLNLGASWDTSLSRKVGEAYAEQLLYFNSNQIFSPGLNIIRHPLSGRNNEYFSEDPVLTGKLAAANIIGTQINGCIATPKHYVANNFEIGRFQINIDIPQRNLFENYMAGFEIAVKEGDPWSVMTSYNSVNGHFLSANKTLIDELNGWGFKGYIVSDYNAEMEGTAEAMNAGSHVAMPGWKEYTVANIKEAIDSGKMSQEQFDKLFRKVLEIKLSDWLPNPETFGEPKIDLNKQHSLARQLGAESAVLLKNDAEILPLSKDKKIALIGPFANSDLINGWQGSSTNRTDRTITIMQALEEEGVAVEYALGATGQPEELAEITDFPVKAEYYNNMNLDGEAVLIRDEASIQKISFSGSGAAESTEGIKNKAFAFSGQSHLKIGQTSNIKENEDFTWSFWVYLPEQFPDKHGGLMAGYFRRYNEFTITPSYFDIFLFKHRKRLKLNIDIPNQVWSNVNIVRNQGVIGIYVNGEKQDEKAFAFSIPAAELVVGGSNVNDKNSNCYIDEVKLYKRALTPDEIKQATQKEDIQKGLSFHESCDDIAKTVSNLESYEGISNPNTLSARWTGSFTASKTGKYLFNVFSNGGVRFYIDGKKYYDQWQEAWTEGKMRRAWVDMEAGKKYEIVIEFGNWYAHNRGKGGFIKFGYIEPYQEALDLITEAQNVAKQADVAILAVGVPQRKHQGESNDLDHFYLTGYQNELIKAVQQVNPNNIVVLFSAGGIDMAPWLSDTKALVEMFLPGQEGGYSVSDVLLGNVNPSGKLPVTYVHTPSDLEIDLITEKYEESISGFGYKYFDKTNKEPLFPFGYGLSYTNFEMSKLKVNTENKEVMITVDVTNTGKIDGAEVVQVYVSDVESSVEQANKELGGFDKVFLKAGETKTILVKLSDKAFKYYNADKKEWVLEPGQFEILVGNASSNIGLRKKIKL